jgi:hypothetical protein
MVAGCMRPQAVHGFTSGVSKLMCGIFEVPYIKMNRTLMITAQMHAGPTLDQPNSFDGLNAALPGARLGL